MVKITIEEDSKEMYDLFTKHMIDGNIGSLKLFGMDGWGIEKANFSAPFKVTATIFNHNIDSLIGYLEKSKIDVKGGGCNC